MRRKIEIILCVAGIFLFSAGIMGFRGNTHRGYQGEAAPAGLGEQAVPELTKQIRPERPEEINLNPWRVIFPKPTVTLNDEEGELSYRWGDDCVLIDENTVLLSCDCYFAAEALQQKIFYLAEAPDYVPKEVFRQDVRNGSADDEVDPGRKSPELLEWRIFVPHPVQMPFAAGQGSAETVRGYVYELDGGLYCLSVDFQETAFLCDLRELMGELYEFSPWTQLELTSDISVDASRMLACTDEGLYEYDLKQGGKTLLEPSVFVPYEIVHIEGDCDCGETGFEFSGPIAAEYVPGDQGYLFLAGNEYGDHEGITLRSKSGETLYQRTGNDRQVGYRWLESEGAVYLVCFYWENEGAWMDKVDVHTGEVETYTVPDAVSNAENFPVGFVEGEYMIYCSEYASVYWEREGLGKSRYKICQMYSGEIQDLKTTSPDNVVWGQTLCESGEYGTVLVRYPKVF